MRTKYTILRERLETLEAEAAKARRYLEGLEMTNCNLTCHGCGELLKTEGEFARHFYVKQIDEINNLLNLGSCPITKD